MRIAQEAVDTNYSCAQASSNGPLSVIDSPVLLLVAPGNTATAPAPIPNPTNPTSTAWRRIMRRNIASVAPIEGGEVSQIVEREVMEDLTRDRGTDAESNDHDEAEVGEDARVLEHVP
jgi:hypothetical protein